MPFKAKAAYRRHIPKQRHRVTNWAEYDAGLRARGSLTGDRRKVGGQAATAIGGCGPLVGRNFCPKPVPSVPL